MNNCFRLRLMSRKDPPDQSRSIGTGAAPIAAGELSATDLAAAGDSRLRLMQTRYLLVASVITGLVILVAAAVWMATRL